MRHRPDITRTFEELLKAVKRLQLQGDLPTAPTDEQRADWAYGNTVIENSEVTFDMARRAAQRPRAKR